MKPLWSVTGMIDPGCNDVWVICDGVRERVAYRDAVDLEIFAFKLTLYNVRIGKFY